MEGERMYEACCLLESVRQLKEAREGRGGGGRKGWKGGGRSKGRDMRTEKREAVTWGFKLCSHDIDPRPKAKHELIHWK